jgi:hypothetical protein
MITIVQTQTAASLLFFDGGASFNFWSFMVTAAGAVVTITGVTIAIYQIRKTRAAAEAACQAATDTAKKLRSVGAMIDLTRVYVLSNEAVSLLRANNFPGAALRIADVRARLVQIRESPKGKGLQPPTKWQKLVTELATLQESLEQYDGRQEPDDDLEKTLKYEVAAMNDKVNALAASTERSVGEL